MKRLSRLFLSIGLTALLLFIACLMSNGDGRAPSEFCLPSVLAAGGLDCSCGSWNNKGCGAGGCSQYTMSQTRSCNPAGCSSESQCVSSSTCCSCGSWKDIGCGKGGCDKGETYQTRSCNPKGCSSESQCVSSSSCCACDSWASVGCGAGGCPSSQMYQTRKCTPNGCGAATQCVSDDSCISDPNLVSSNWQPYGFALPGDPDYSFTYADNETKNLFALAAKGNIVIGDYTSSQFQNYVLPKIDSGSGSITQPYVIDPTDAPLGYHTGDGGLMYDAQGRPLFDGNYTLADRGFKSDGSPRKFFESTLKDADFTALIDYSDQMYQTCGDCGATIDAVLFTNHLLAGTTGRDLNINGAMVSRDDGLMLGDDFRINHDIRLLKGSGSGLSSQIGLPASLAQPKLVIWEECPSTGCPP